jgi:hypothetical protein
MQSSENRSLVFIRSASSDNIADRSACIAQGEFYHSGFISIRRLSQIACAGAQSDILIRAAEGAAQVRQWDRLEAIGELLLSTGTTGEHWYSGAYYLALVAYLKGRNLQARSAFAWLADAATPGCRAKAMLSLSATFYKSGDHLTFFDVASEAIRFTEKMERFDPRLQITALRNLGLYSSTIGDHAGALLTLEKLFPIVRSVSSIDPCTFYQYLNSYAVELGATGRLEEADNVSKIVLASPYAPVFPEWRETANDIALKTPSSERSFVSFFLHTASSAGDTQRFPKAQRRVLETQSHAKAAHSTRGSVTYIAEWKAAKMRSEQEQSARPSNGIPENVERMDRAQVLIELLDRTSDEDLPDDHLRQLLRYLIELQNSHN